jgi:hypothetical protein
MRGVGVGVGTVTVGAFGALVALALVSGCSTSKKPSAAAATPTTAATTATAAATASAAVIRAEYLAAIAPVDKLRDEYEASKGTPARASIAPPFAASLRTFDAVVAKWPTSGRTETDLQTMISYDQLVASEVSANDLTVPNVNRDDAAHATVRADLGLPPA